MGRIKGPIQFEGSLGNIRSYWDSDAKQQTVSTKRQGYPKAFKNRKSAARQKELNLEFKGVNIWTKLLRRGNDDLSYLKKGRLNGKLVSIGKGIQLMNSLDKRGHKRIESSKFNFPLIGFCMNNEYPFQNVCHAEPEISITDNRREVTVRLTNFISGVKLRWPERIMHYRVYLNIFELPDVEWDPEHRRYWPVYPSTALGNKTTVSEWRSIITTPIDFELPAAFDAKYVSKEKAVVVVTMGFEFASGIQYDTPYVVKDHGTCAIVGCF
jgi:hypothetical protein